MYSFRLEKKPLHNIMFSFFKHNDEGDGKQNIASLYRRASTQFTTKWHLQMRDINNLSGFETNQIESMVSAANQENLSKKVAGKIGPVDIYRRRNARYFEHKRLQGDWETTKHL